MSLQFHTTYCEEFLPSDWLTCRLDGLRKAHQDLQDGTGLGGEFSAWVRPNLPPEEVTRMKEAAKDIARRCDAFVVVGIGGSYLGARAIMELLLSPHYNLLAKDTPQIFFAGNSLSSDAFHELTLLLEGKDVIINVISKSGATIETTAAYLLLRQLMSEKYSEEELKSRIIVTTDPCEGALRHHAQEEGLCSFPIPSAVGGRYSLLTAAGLLPLAVAGVDIDALLEGAVSMAEELRLGKEDNIAFRYAAARQALYRKGKLIELLVGFDPHSRIFGEWWKQLFGESEGKKGLGIFPATAEFCADLHSMGQYIQDGPKILFETLLRFGSNQRLAPKFNKGLTSDKDDYLLKHDLDDIDRETFLGTIFAHVDGGVPNLLLSVGERRPFDIGELIYFFQYACGLSAYLQGVNPFDQPGVESYKQNTHALLGDPKLEELRHGLLCRIC